MEMIEELFEVILKATNESDEDIGVELSIYPDSSSSMYGENVYYILFNGEIEEEFFFIADVLKYLRDLK